MPSKVDVFSDWVTEVVGWAPGDEGLPGGLHSINLTLNRKRLAEFLENFGDDSDLQNFLLLDQLAVGIGAEISSTGEVEEVADLALRPFRLWEYVWLYKVLGLSQPGKRVLDLGGPASHVLILAALAGNQIHTIDINPRIVEAGRNCAEAFRLDNYRAELGDMRELSSIAPNSVDRILCSSVLEHFTDEDQKRALSEMARVLAPGGLIGLTFDYGAPAPGGASGRQASREAPRSRPWHSRLYTRLQVSGRRQISRLQRAKVEQQCAAERLLALEEAHAELTRLYSELGLREQKRVEEKEHTKGLEKSRAEIANRLEEATQSYIREMAAARRESDRLRGELAQRQESLVAVQNQLSGAQSELAALRSESLIAHIRRRWQES